MPSEKELKYGDSANDKITFLTKNASIIGANGSGKSSLMRKFKELNSNFTTISAHKNLTIKQGQHRAQDDDWLNQHKSFYDSPITWWTATIRDNNNVQNDFNQIIEIVFREYTDSSVEALNEALKNGGKISKEIDRKLDKIFTVWNSIFIDKQLLYNDKKIKVQVIGKDDYYDIENLSDGERIALYVLIKISLSEIGTTVIIDEPETFLNPAILNSLFDECEKIKSDSNFIYFSHDLEFVTTRKDNTIFWIKKFTYPNEWEILPTDAQEIPEELIVKVIGAKKTKILFVESEKNYDAQLYQFLYPDFKIWPVWGCENVINYTKAFNSRTEKFNKEYFGLIDRDLRSAPEIKSLQEKKIFCLPVAIHENLFLLKNIVKFVFKFLWRKDFIDKFSDLEIDVRKKLMDWNFALAYKKWRIKREFDIEIDSITNGSKKFSPNMTIYDNEITTFSSKKYKDILKIFNQKNLKTCTSKIGYNWSNWHNIVLNIFTTSEENSFRQEYLKIMPCIK